MAGRPEHKLTEKQLIELDKMAHQNCKDYTIACALDIDVTTLKKHYSKRLIKKRALGRIELKEAQRITAIKDKNPALLIFLGKNELDQVDKQEIKQTGDSGPVITEAEKQALTDLARGYKVKLANPKPRKVL